MNRRTFLDVAAASTLLPRLSLAADKSRLDFDDLRGARGWVVPVDPKAPVGDLKLERDGGPRRWTPRLVNRGKKAVRIREVVVFSLPHQLPAETQLYGESFQMLSQTTGTVGKPADLGYSEPKHYKIPGPDDAAVVTSLLTLTPPGQGTQVLAFTSCRRFIGRFYLRPGAIDVAVDTEGLELAPGETWALEELAFAEGAPRAELLAGLARRMNENHPPLRWKTPPTRWCSWYCFGAKVTDKNVLDNLEVIAKRVPQLKYVQIDDGYQPAMGDWLETGKAFGGNVTGVLKEIRKRGFEPAIWVAPFIAEKDSHLYQQHPDWFVKGDDGQPQPADKVTFRGWRRYPWYSLDGTHPEVQKHLRQLFHTMRNEWGCTYFKLDANFWGAIHGGRFHDRKATRIEAYRRGMQAILEGAGDSFILGCNHPIWPSLGLIHGSRSSGDIKRTWEVVAKTGKQNLSRAWQNGRLWWNDPDAVVLTGDLGDDVFQLHATVIYASGGMILSGDDLTKIPPARLGMLKKLLPPTGVAAEFEDESLRIGTVAAGNKRMICLFNWGETKQTLNVKLPGPARVTDFWSGADLGKKEGTLAIADMPPRSARLLVCQLLS
ncbi:MAG TPA: glycoside hydrolase family 36 protein [Polyangia bacterium]|nr:glycoside hydrolase family 36 protein [Polyangia bacterium]